MEKHSVQNVRYEYEVHSYSFRNEPGVSVPPCLSILTLRYWTPSFSLMGQMCECLIKKHLSTAKSVNRWMRHVVKHFIRTSPYVIYKNQKPYLPYQNPLWLFELSLWSPHWLLYWCFRCGWRAAVCYWTIATDTQNKPPHQGSYMSRRIKKGRFSSDGLAFMRLQHLPVSVWLCLCSCTDKRNCKRLTCLCYQHSYVSPAKLHWRA